MDLASSVASLIGLAGLAVNSASALYTFCRKIPRVEGEVEAVLDEIRTLSQTLESIQQVVSGRGTQTVSVRTSGLVVKLQEAITRCTADLRTWTTSMAALEMEDGKWARNSVKRLKLAADAGRFSETRLQISSHKDQLALLLELLTVDLGLSTSLDVQAIDSKVDSLAVEHASSQNINARHLERIQQEVHSVGLVQHTTHETTLGISRSTVRIHDTLQDIQISQASSHQTTRRQLESLDARIAAMQRSILNIPHQKAAKTRRRVRRPDSQRHASQEGRSLLGLCSELEQRTPEPPAISTQLNRLVDIAVIARHRCGKWHLETVPIPDSAFEAADPGTRLRMVKHPQDLRLPLWLLSRKECGRDRLLNPSSLAPSELMPEAHLVSSWSLSMSSISTTWLGLAIFGYEYTCSEKDIQVFLSGRTIYRSGIFMCNPRDLFTCKHRNLFMSKLQQAATDSILFFFATTALLLVIKRWILDTRKWIHPRLQNIGCDLNLLEQRQLDEQDLLINAKLELQFMRDLKIMIRSLGRCWWMIYLNPQN